MPGEQPKIKGLIKLNTNENPYPPSPRVLRAVKAALDGRLRLYPNPTAERLREKLAELHRCKPENIIVGNGSDECLALAVRAFVEPVAADVGRRLPGTLVVNVVEIEPVALAPQANGTLVPIDLAGRPLPYDPAEAPADLPIAASADSLLARVLGVVRDTDPSLFARLTTGARMRDDIVLETEGRRLWFSGDATADAVRAVVAVAEDLARRGRAWQELDGRFAGQVVVRGMGAGA